MGHLRDKWHADALVEFLKDPAKTYPATRMPHFRLEDEEATQLAAYLIANSRMIKRKPLVGDATRGATLLVSAGCLIATLVCPRRRSPRWPPCSRLARKVAFRPTIRPAPRRRTSP
jgi:hypothetical protein